MASGVTRGVGPPPAHSSQARRAPNQSRHGKHFWMFPSLCLHCRLHASKQTAYGFCCRRCLALQLSTRLQKKHICEPRLLRDRLLDPDPVARMEMRPERCSDQCGTRVPSFQPLSCNHPIFLSCADRPSPSPRSFPPRVFRPVAPRSSTASTRTPLSRPASSPSSPPLRPSRPPRARLRRRRTSTLS